MLSAITFIDITLVAFLIYTALILLRRTHSIFIFRGIVVLFGLYLLATYFHLALTHALFQLFFSFFVIVLVVVFQRELRRFFEEFSLSLTSIFVDERTTLDTTAAEDLVAAILEMARKRRGALIVLPGKQPIDRHLEGGYFLNGEISKPLVLSIFDPSSPGHDGALVVKENKIQRFAAHLPLAREVVGELGTRHRAAVGLSERTDALVVVVSEERGVVSLARNGTLTPLARPALVAEELALFYKKEFAANGDPYWVHIIKDKPKEKLLAIGLALLLWFVLVYRQ